MRRSLPLLAAQLIVLALIAVLQVWTITTIGGALKPPTAGSVLMDEEEADDVTLADERVAFAVIPLATRWSVQVEPPAPVHLEPDGKPPSA